MRVLIAEDEPLVAEELRSRLESLGHGVLDVAYDGCGAVAKAEALTPDLIFLDVKLPDRDGLAVAECIMARRPVPIILVTAYGDPALIEHAMQTGAMGYLVKPVDRKALLPAMTLAVTRFAELMALRKEAQSLREALRLRQQVERAKGVLAARIGVYPEVAQQRLQRFAVREGVPLKEAVARVLAAEKFFGDVEETR